MSDSRKKILWIEDDHLLGTIVSKDFAGEFNLMIAINADEAFQILKGMTPDLIIVDLVLPGDKNGFEILKKLSEDSRLKDIPSIVLSNLSKQADIDRAMSFGAKKYLVKATMSLEQIKQEVRAVMS